MDSLIEAMRRATMQALQAQQQKSQEKQRATTLFNERTNGGQSMFRPLSAIADYDRETARNFVSEMLNNRDILEIGNGHDGISLALAKKFITDSAIGLQRFTETEVERGFNIFDLDLSQALTIIRSYISEALGDEPIYQDLQSDMIVFCGVIDACENAFNELQSDYRARQNQPNVVIFG